MTPDEYLAIQKRERRRQSARAVVVTFVGIPLAVAVILLFLRFLGSLGL